MWPVFGSPVWHKWLGNYEPRKHITGSGNNLLLSHILFHLLINTTFVLLWLPCSKLSTLRTFHDTSVETVVLFVSISESPFVVTLVLILLLSYLKDLLRNGRPQTNYVLLPVYRWLGKKISGHWCSYSP